MKKPILIALALLLVSSFTFSQSRETGAVTGTVTDEQGSALPGVNLTLTSPALMGARTAVSDANGAFRFPALPPGTYSVKAELQNFGSVVQENIRLTTTTTLSVTLVLKPAAVAEQVTVIAKAPTVDIKSTETASVTLGNEVLRNIPNAQFSTDIVNMAPGVSNDVAYGAAAGRGVSWQMDGVGVGDPDYGTAWVFVDYNIIQEAKVMGIGLPAEYGNFTGVIFNIVTKSGGNQFSGHFEADFQGNKARDNVKASFPGGSFWGTENNGAYLADWGLTSPLEKLFDINAHLGGPILKDKLWFYAGAQWYRSQNWVTGFPYAQDYKQPRLFFKLSSQLDARTNASAAVEWDNYRGTYRGAAARVMPDATRDQIDPEVVLNFNLTHILSPSTFFDVKAAYFKGYYNLEPRTGRDVYMHYFLDDNPDIAGNQARWRYYNWGSYAEHDRNRLQINASLTHYAEDFIKGNHDFKFGVEFEHSRVKNVLSYTGVGGSLGNSIRYYDYWTPPEDLPYTDYPYTGNYSAYQYEGYNAQTRITRLEGFAQDSWQITKRLNISLGVRASQNWGKVVDGIGTPFNTFRLAPRIGFSYDILGDKTTVLKAHYGEFTDGMYASFLDRLSPHFSDWMLYYWDAEGGYWYEDEDARVTHGTWTVDPDLKHPFMRQFTVGIERELFKDTSLSVTYINRSYHNMVTCYNVGSTYSAVPYSIDSEIPGVVNRDFTLYNRDSSSGEWQIINVDKLTELYSDLGININPYRKYWGLEFLFNKRFSNRWQMMASYVYSQAKGTLDNSSAADDLGWNEWYDPNYWINADGHMTGDPTHMIKLQGTYLLPLDISLNVYFHAITGDAWAQQYRLRRFLDQGTVTFYTEAAGSHHYPMAKSLDIRLEKTFLLADKYRLGIIFDVFNVFNDDSITSWGTRIDYDWYADGSAPSTSGHELSSIVLPRRARVGLRLQF